MLKKRSQAALEFIMTYGWAILVVLVAIGALSYFGVLSPDKFLPSRCTLPAGIACLDHLVQNFGPGNGEVSVTLKNSLGYDTTSVTVTASDCTSAASQPTFKNAEQRTFTASGCSISGQKYNGQVNVTFTNADTSISHTFQGSVITRVE
ncbi:hypothetical protein HYS31_03655 [Candidatus Woesearchaeota archaeon]|nr:hypothetical protein [Candidatus Woesearchaeota archaeon]